MIKMRSLFICAVAAFLLLSASVVPESRAGNVTIAPSSGFRVPAPVFIVSVTSDGAYVNATVSSSAGTSTSQLAVTSGSYTWTYAGLGVGWVQIGAIHEDGNPVATSGGTAF